MASTHKIQAGAVEIESTTLTWNGGAIGSGPTVHPFTSGTPTLVASPAGAINRLSGTVSGATLPPAVLGESAVVEVIGIGPIAISPDGSNTINGAGTAFSLLKATNPIRTVAKFICDAAGAWTVGVHQIDGIVTTAGNDGLTATIKAVDQDRTTEKPLTIRATQVILITEAASFTVTGGATTFVAPGIVTINTDQDIVLDTGATFSVIRKIDGVEYGRDEAGTGITNGAQSVDFITIIIANNTSCLLSARVQVSNDTDNQGGAFSEMFGSFSRSGGNAVQNGATVGGTGMLSANISTATLTWVLSGNNVILRGTGVAAIDITWKGLVSVAPVTIT